MSKFLSFIKTKDKKTVVTIAVAGLLAVISAVGFVSAVGPSFNIFPIGFNQELNHDYPLLDARNITKGEDWSVSASDHAAGVTADPGDTIEFLVYYHNGAPTAPENIANNVVVKATMPTTAGNLHNVGASISASNTATVTSAQKGGDMQVKINGSIPQSLTLVSGSTIWLPDRGTRQVTMPNTITTSGVNLGSIEACWDFTGFVKFRVKVSSTQPDYAIDVDKQVKNVSTNSAYADSVNADPGDTVEFKIVGTNTGDTNIFHFEFTDTLPSKLTLVANSVSMNHSNSGNLFGTGLVTTNTEITPGQSVTITFRALVADESQFPIGTTTLTNTGFLKTSGNVNLGPISDTARVVVTKAAPQICTLKTRALFNGSAFSGSLNYRATGPQTINGSTVPTDHTGVTPGTYVASYLSGGPMDATFDGVTPSSGNCPANGSITFTFNFSRPSVFNLSIDKTVKNVTAGGSFADSVNAEPSQRVEFKIVVTNTGNSDVANVNMRDILPSELTYISNTFRVDGVTVALNSFFSTSGKTLNTMVAGQTTTITFQADIAGQNQFPVGTTTLVNEAKVKGANVSEKSDTAVVKVIKEAPQKEDGDNGNRPN